MQIGGKTKKIKPTQPQVVVQVAHDTNEYLKFVTDDKGHIHIEWIGDPNAATKFESKYSAKSRIREIANIPASRVFRQLEA